MKLNYVLVLSPLWLLTAVLPSLAQGVSGTTVMNFSASPQGHEERSNRVVTREQSSENGFSITTDSQRDSSRTSNRANGAETTTVLTNGTINTSITRERGERSSTTVFEFSESFDYADFVNNNTVTTGASGDRGPRWRNPDPVVGPRGR